MTCLRGMTCLLSLLLLCTSSSAADDTDRPDVLVVSLDTLGAGHLGAYGYDRETSPVLDRLAKEGVIFEHASAPAPATPSSHMTLFTSTLTCVHGIDGARTEVVVTKAFPTLAEVLGAAGYETGAFTENAWVTPALGFDRGFDVFEENTSPDLMAPTGQAEKTFGEALEWIKARKSKPWFAFVHTYQVHHPYAPPEELVQVVAPNHGKDRASVDRALYDAEIRHTDRLLGEFLAGIEAVKRDRPLLLVVLSDHGEAFGEHGQFQHGFSLYEELLHVPLIFHSKGRITPRRVSDRVGLIDVAPTVLDVLGLPALPNAQGRSLAPLLEGESIAPRTTFAELSVLKKIAAYSGDTKRIIDLAANEAEVYDLAADPGEERPQSRGPVDSATADVIDAYRALCRADPGAPTTEKALSPEVRKKLKALGYLE